MMFKNRSQSCHSCVYHNRVYTIAIDGVSDSKNKKRANDQDANKNLLSATHVIILSTLIIIELIPNSRRLSFISVIKSVTEVLPV